MNMTYVVKEFEPANRIFIVEYRRENTEQSILLNLPMPIREGELICTPPELDEFIRAFAPEADFDYLRLLNELDPAPVKALIPPPTMEELGSLLLGYVDEHLHATAQERNYDSVLTICTYGDTGNAKFDAEGIAFKRWRSQVWERCYALQADVLSGVRSVPSKEELIALLPKMEWPS